jgi:hypothetical protein
MFGANAPVRLLAATQTPEHLGNLLLVPAELFHHLAGGFELLDNAIDVGNLRSAPERDPPAARCVEDLGALPFAARHRTDDRFDP